MIPCPPPCRLMASPHIYRTDAVVLRQRRLGDADKICVLFTPQRGRIEAVAKGVRRTKSRLAGHVEPLTRTQRCCLPRDGHSTS